MVRTYLVSGSIYDNLDPGTFRVYSRSEAAVGIDDSGTMKYFVRFTTGDQGAAIGFHDIPIDEGAAGADASPSSAPRCRTAASARRARTRSRCGSSRPIGTTVVVTALKHADPSLKR